MYNKTRIALEHAKDLVGFIYHNFLKFNLSLPCIQQLCPLKNGVAGDGEKKKKKKKKQCEG